MRFIYLFIFFTMIASLNLIQAQNTKAIVVEQKTKTPIPYATIKYGEFKGVITNEEGFFNITDVLKKSDSLKISSIGYASQNITVSQLKDSLFLVPKEIELSSVFLSSKKYTVDEILENIKENLEANYIADYTKQRFFMRESYIQHMKQFKFDFLKCSIKEISEKLLDSMVNLVPQKSSYYNETLGDFYSIPNTTQTKLTLIKASKLYDKNSDATSDALQEKFTAILKKNIKKDSYLKIKSGWFGSKVQVDSILPDKKKSIDSLQNELKKRKKEQKWFFASRKNTLSKMMKNLFFDDESDLNIIDKSNRYEFTLKGVIEFQDDLAYVLDYKPKWREDFKGTLYVNTNDFAVLRMDYESVDPIYDKKFNLLGININHLKYKGTAVFSKGDLNYYSLKYASHTNISSAKINRPLTIIEKNKHVKGRRKQNELKLDMHIHSVNISKKEIVVFDTESLSNIKNIKENKDIEIKYFSSYNANYWKGYNIIEPNTAIKAFKTITPDD